MNRTYGNRHTDFPASMYDAWRASSVAEEEHPMVLVDTCYGMTGGDLYVCSTCQSRVVVMADAAVPSCPAGPKEDTSA
jgi:hypothetical protein